MGHQAPATLAVDVDPEPGSVTRGVFLIHDHGRVGRVRGRQGVLPGESPSRGSAIAGLTQSRSTRAGIQSIAHAPDRDEVARGIRLRLDLASKPADVDVDRSWIAVVVRTPHPIEQLPT